MDLLPLLKKKLLSTSLIASGNRLILGVSGGIDSMVLLDLLDRLRKTLSLDLVVAHLNHGMRGRSSDADAQFVKNEAEKRGLVFRGKTLPKGFFEGKGNFQDLARRTRYRFFTSVAKRFKVKKIVTAHQADDQLETFLMRLLRGSGQEGLKGMSLKRPLEEGGGSFELLRPLLFFSRDQIKDYARWRKVKWREDASNQKEDYLRNRIRRRLVPEMKLLSPQVVEKVAQTLDSLQKEEKWVGGVVESGFLHHRRRRNGEIRIEQKWLKSQEEAYRFRIYRKALEAGGVRLKGIGRTQLEAVDQMVMSHNRRARVSLPRGFGAYVTEKQLIFKKWIKTQRLQKRGFFC